MRWCFDCEISEVENGIVCNPYLLPLDTRSDEVGEEARADAAADDGARGAGARLVAHRHRPALPRLRATPRGVAPHVAHLKKQRLETVFSLHGLKGWKQGGFKLWVNFIHERVRPHRGERPVSLSVAVQVALEINL
jgi:hypothetical protein